MKKEVNAKRDEQKQEVMKKGRKKLVRKKKSKEIHFKNTEEFFQRERYKAIKLIKHVFVRKNAFLDWKRIEKRKGRSFRKEET